MSTQWITRQILAIQRQAEPTRFNPRPAGLMLSGSSTHAVYEWLSTRRSRLAWWSRIEIVNGTGRNHKAIDWALIYLRQINAIECSKDECRNARYLRYRIRTTNEGSN